MNQDFSKRIPEVIPKFIETLHFVQTWEEFKLFEEASGTLLKEAEKQDKHKASTDPRFNSINWAHDVEWLIDQIFFSFYWLEAFSKFFEEKYDSSNGPYGEYWPTSYFADNCMLGIYSCRDKIALMVWAFYCPFDIRNKNEILDFNGVMKKLRHPIKYAIKAEGSTEFWGSLNGLNDHIFKSIAEYRHKKIHRREPRVIMGEIPEYYYRDYVFPVLDECELESWKQALEAKGNSQEVIDNILRGSIIDGVRFRSKPVEGLLISYSDVKDQIEQAFKKTLKVAATCFDILDSRLFPK